MKRYNPQKIADSAYVESGSWKCEKSPTGAHFWIGNFAEMRCKYCENTKKAQDLSKTNEWVR